MGLFLICRVTGLFPFGSRRDAMLTEKIMSGKFTKNDLFNRLTKECQDLISHLLEVDSTKRYSAKEALKDPWFTNGDQSTIVTPTDMKTVKTVEGADSRVDRVTLHRRNG